MNSSMTIAFWSTIFTLVGYVSNLLGLTDPLFTFNVPQTTIDDGSGSGSGCSGVFCWDALADFVTSLLGMLAWFANAIAGFFQLLTFQVNGLSPTAASFITVPIAIMIFVIIIKLVRRG